MTTKAHITSDFATPNDVASRLRIPASRAAELRRQLFELHVSKADDNAKKIIYFSSAKTRKGPASARSKKK